VTADLTDESDVTSSTGEAAAAARHTSHAAHTPAVRFARRLFEVLRFRDGAGSEGFQCTVSRGFN
jgi:hypothetical protein